MAEKKFFHQAICPEKTMIVITVESSALWDANDYEPADLQIRKIVTQNRWMLVGCQVFENVTKDQRVEFLVPQLLLRFVGRYHVVSQLGCHFSKTLIRFNSDMLRVSEVSEVAAKATTNI